MASNAYFQSSASMATCPCFCAQASSQYLLAQKIASIVPEPLLKPYCVDVNLSSAPPACNLFRTIAAYTLYPMLSKLMGL